MDSDHPLSDKEIIAKLAKYGIDVNFIPYKSLKTLDVLDDILPCILLYELHFPIGHWCAIFENQQGLNFFDPLGFVPDGLLVKGGFDHPAGREAMGANFTYLTDLLIKYQQDHGVKVIYNEVPLQSPNSDVCGHWVSLRLLSQNLTNDQFNRLLKKYPVSERQKKVRQLFNKL